MSMNLIILVIIFYILKNNSCQYCYAENKYQKLLLFLLFINEIDQCLNNKYRYSKYYMNYSNCAKNNSNNITNTPINKNNDNFIDNSKNNIINNNEESSINNNKDTFINNDNIINNGKNLPTDNNKNTIINRANVINDIFNLINSDKDTTTKNNKDNSTSKNTNSNLYNPKNKLVKSNKKIDNELLTYTDPCQKTNNIISNSISNTFKQIQLGKIITNINEFTKNFNLIVPAPLTGAKVKVPVLVGSTNITELFHGKVTFGKPIISILKITNEVFITSKSILPNLHTNANNAVLHYEGFLKTQLEYLEDVIIEKYQIKCDSKHYIMLIPFSGSKDLNITDEIINSHNIVFTDFTLDIDKSTFFVDTCLEEPVKGNKYVNLYKTCDLAVKIECEISLYRKKLVDL